MNSIKRFFVSCISLGAFLLATVPALADNNTDVQTITWVKPNHPIQVAAPSDKNPEVIAPHLPANGVRHAGLKALHPSNPRKPEVKVSVPEPEAVTPLFPDKITLSEIVSSYYGSSAADVEKAFNTYGYTDDALVALFMANASNARLDRICALRLGNSWKNVIGFLQLNTKYLFRNLLVVHVPKENNRNCMSLLQFISWRNEPDFRDLGDLSVRELVGASLIDNRFHVGPLEALRQVHEAGSVINALSQYAEIK